MGPRGPLRDSTCGVGRQGRRRRLRIACSRARPLAWPLHGTLGRAAALRAARPDGGGKPFWLPGGARPPARYKTCCQRWGSAPEGRGAGHSPLSPLTVRPPTRQPLSQDVGNMQQRACKRGQDRRGRGTAGNRAEFKLPCGRAPTGGLAAPPADALHGLYRGAGAPSFHRDCLSTACAAPVGLPWPRLRAAGRRRALLHAAPPPPPPAGSRAAPRASRSKGLGLRGQGRLELDLLHLLRRLHQLGGLQPLRAGCVVRQGAVCGRISRRWGGSHNTPASPVAHSRRTSIMAGRIWLSVASMSAAPACAWWRGGARRPGEGGAV